MDLIAFILVTLFIGIIATFLLAYVLDDLFHKFNYKPTKRTAKIIMHILVVIEYVFISLMTIDNELCDNLDLWQIILVILVSYILSYLCGYVIMKNSADICPNCGEWNRIEYLEELDRDDYKQRVDVERDIHNKEGEKIGSYDASEVRDFTTYTDRYRCKACGKSYIRKWTMQR